MNYTKQTKASKYDLLSLLIKEDTYKYAKQNIGELEAEVLEGKINKKTLNF